MTLKEEAYSLINQLPDNCVEEVVRDMKSMMESSSTWKTPAQRIEKKMQALRELQALREDARKLGSMDYATAREEAMYEKFGI